MQSVTSINTNSTINILKDMDDAGTMGPENNRDSLGDSCCVASFKGVMIHAGDCLASCWDKQGSLSPNVLEDFGSRELGPLVRRYSLLVPDAREQ